MVLCYVIVSVYVWVYDMHLWLSYLPYFEFQDLIAIAASTCHKFKSIENIKASLSKFPVLPMSAIALIDKDE